MSPSNTDSSEEGWQRFAAAYQIGDVLECTVVSVVPFGTFVEVGDAVHGLLPGAALTVGDSAESAQLFPTTQMTVHKAQRHLEFEDQARERAFRRRNVMVRTAAADTR